MYYIRILTLPFFQSNRKIKMLEDDLARAESKTEEFER